MDEERSGGSTRRLRSFVLGGLVGASAAMAAARRLGPRQRSRPVQAGLAAFEDAPCFRETVEREELQAQPRSRPSSS
jgi:hypothetical protein